VKAQVQRAQNLLNRKTPKPIEALAVLKPLMKSGTPPWPVYHFAGIAYALLGDHTRCEEAMRAALDGGSAEPETYHTLSVALYKQEKYAEAESFARQVVQMKPDFVKALLNLGLILQAQARLEDALQIYARANQLDPGNAVIAFKIGVIYKNLGNFAKAVELFDIAMKMDPTYEGPVIEKAGSLIKQRDFEKSDELLADFLRRKPNSVEARSLLADSKKEQSLYDEAIVLYKEVLDDNPRNPGVRVNYGLCLQEMGRYDESEKEYLRALDTPPPMMESMSNYLMVMHYNPERTREYIFEAHKKWDAFFAPAERPERPVPADRSPDKRLRVGFVSGGFRSHPVGWMITRGLEELSPENYEIYCYTTNNINDKITQRIATRADKWRSVVGFNDEVVARLIREDEIDILVELSGHAGDNRLRAVAMEPAPVIVKWVGGLFNSTGLRSIDYLISDWNETPGGVEEFYTEKLVRMPDDYICFMPPSYAPEVSVLPALEQGFVTFGCFNNPSKINPQLLSRWGVLLARVPGSKLFLKSGQYDSVEFQERILGALADAGIGRDRVIFEGRSPHEELLGAYSKVDIALDPWPYSGGLSTCEALWQGVPVVTYPGPTFAGRHSVTHLRNAGLPEMVADSWDEYVDKAAGLAGDLDALAGLRARLRDQVASSPLCDGERFGAALGDAFRQMWHAYAEDRLRQDHIAVSDAVGREVSVVGNDVPVVGNDVSAGGSDDAAARTSSKVSTAAGEASEGRSSGVSYDAKPLNEHNDRNLGLVSTGETEALTSEIKDVPVKAASLPESNTVVPQWDDTFLFETSSKVAIILPDSQTSLTSFVFREQNRWIDPEVEYLQRFISTGDTMLDVGAGFGAYALSASKIVGETGRVYAIEPNAQMFNCLKESKRENDFTNLNLYNLAVSNDGTAMRLDDSTTPELVAAVSDNQGSIKAQSIDNWWIEQGKPAINLLKIDVNGGELNLLDGARNLIATYSPALIIASPSSVDAFIALQSRAQELGYRLFQLVEQVGQLAEIESVDQIDGYQMNLVALGDAQKKRLSQNGFVYTKPSIDLEVSRDVWAEWFGVMPWTGDYLEDWKADRVNNVSEDFYHVLNLIAVANSDGSTSTSERTYFLLEATNLAVDLLGKGEQHIALRLTLSYLLYTLGKREKAVEIMLSILNETQFGAKSILTNLPFVLPVLPLNFKPINTEFNKWIMVRLLESWLKLKDITAFSSGDMEQKIRAVLKDNPETIEKGQITEPDADGATTPVFVHILFNNIHTQSALETFHRLNTEFSDMKHVCFLEKSQSIQGFDVDVRGLDNVVVFEAKLGLNAVYQAILNLKPAGVVYHGLFFDWQYKLVDEIPSSINQYWVMWGGDLYNPIRSGLTRKDSIAKIRGVLTDVPGDKEIFAKEYGPRDDLPSFGYGVQLSVDEEVDDELKNRIIIGNSGDPSNNHLEILQAIHAKKDWRNYKYVIPFSYNAPGEYRDVLYSTLKKLGMQDHVMVFTEFMPVGKYNAMLKASKLFILAHQRQQAHGSIKAQLVFGNPVVVRKHIELDGNRMINPTWDFFTNPGYELVDFGEFSSKKRIELVLESVNSNRKTSRKSYLDSKSKEYIQSVRSAFICITSQFKKDKEIEIL